MNLEGFCSFFVFHVNFSSNSRGEKNNKSEAKKMKKYKLTLLEWMLSQFRSIHQYFGCFWDIFSVSGNFGCENLNVIFLSPLRPLVSTANTTVSSIIDIPWDKMVIIPASIDSMSLHLNLTFWMRELFNWYIVLSTC